MLIFWLAIALSFLPSKPKERVLGQVFKILIVYDLAWWRNRGLSGTANTPNEPIDYLVDSSNPVGKPGILVALASGSRAVQLSQMDDDTRTVTVLDYIQKVLGQGCSPSTAFTLRELKQRQNGAVIWKGQSNLQNGLVQKF